MFERALAMIPEGVPDSGLCPKILSCLALLDAEEGAFEAATSKLERARELLHATDRAQEILGLLCAEGRVAFLRGDQESALQILAEAEGLVGSLRLPPEADIRVQLDDLRLLLTP